MEFDAVWLDAGGVLVLQEPAVLGPLLAPFGGDTATDRHVRAHYAAMAAKSHAVAGEHDWASYDAAYVRAVGVPEDNVTAAADAMAQVRDPWLWRYAIPESVAALRELSTRDVPLAIISNAAGHVAKLLADTAVCQIGDGDCVSVRTIVDSQIVGVAKPDPAIMDHAAEHFVGIDRDRIAYVGDSVTMDVACAAAAGLHPVLLDPFDDHPDADFDRISSLADLLD